ncbi:uncharacterized protein LOC143019938 [Oratosquilla oratoria]|uniref:uncharacterized protein LOC143019938 n=1 Tax=Oratosquilla oratoria TaxID=337810 RepID=UPI003F76A0C6
MKQLLLLLGSFLLALRAEGWDENHKFYNCHTQRDLMEHRMPDNLDNLVALIEKWERTEAYKSPYDMANALLKRYKHDGVIYRANQIPEWAQRQTREKGKQDVCKRFVSLFETVPEDMYEPREECALYRALSHSVDTFPFGGTNENWDDAYRRRRRRRRRDIEIPEADHPIENGVIRTPSGPIAAGTLLGGIMAMDQSGSKTIQSVIDSENIDFMKDEMKRSSVLPLHAFTLAGDIAQTSIIQTITQDYEVRKFLGDRGIFGNCTACPRQYSLEQTKFSHMTQAEIFAGIDALLIAKAKPSFTSSLRLSQILRSYYSGVGLPGRPDYKACNRMELYKTELDGDRETLREQILHSMFAYTTVFDEIQLYIQGEDWTKIKNEFEKDRDEGWNAFTSFVNNYNYQDFEKCEMFSKDVPCQSSVDLVMIYGHEGGVIDGEFQREFIAHMGQVLGVGEHRSRMGILDGKTGDWREPMTNFSNVADWGCNFTETMTSGSSGAGMLDVIDELTAYYHGVYKELREKPETASAHAQVVLWYVGSNPSDQDEFERRLENFRYTFRDVYILMMGRSKGNYIDYMVDPNKDFFSVSSFTEKPEKMAREVAKRICQVPSVFIYPSCKDSEHRESGHEYKNYLSPNRTTFMIINPYNFFTSDYLKLTFGDSNIRVCGSRTNMNPVEGADETNCKDAPTDFEYWNLCDGYMSSCRNIYLGVTSLSSGYSCTDEECEYPNQVEYTMKHEGMICGSSALLPSILLLLAAMAFHTFRS